MNFKFSLLNDLLKQDNAHIQGVKQVFVSNEDTTTALTQFAYGSMQPNHESGMHAHATMDEYFYFIKGTATYYIDGQKVDVLPGTFINIPATINHNLVNTGTAALEFVYFGIAI